eukprot:Skav228823  [mRNA]  locus=scaffold359:464953:466782:- [translate_table: standard]
MISAHPIFQLGSQAHGHSRGSPGKVATPCRVRRKLSFGSADSHDDLSSLPSRSSLNTTEREACMHRAGTLDKLSPQETQEFENTGTSLKRKKSKTPESKSPPIEMQSSEKEEPTKRPKPVQRLKAFLEQKKAEKEQAALRKAEDKKKKKKKKKNKTAKNKDPKSPSKIAKEEADKKRRELLKDAKKAKR